MFPSLQILDLALSPSKYFFFGSFCFWIVEGEGVKAVGEFKQLRVVPKLNSPTALTPSPSTIQKQNDPKKKYLLGLSAKSRICKLGNIRLH
jgi:hypothetical protein